MRPVEAESRSRMVWPRATEPRLLRRQMKSNTARLARKAIPATTIPAMAMAFDDNLDDGMDKGIAVEVTVVDVAGEDTTMEVEVVSDDDDEQSGIVYYFLNK